MGTTATNSTTIIEHFHLDTYSNLCHHSPPFRWVRHHQTTMTMTTTTTNMSFFNFIHYPLLFLQSLCVATTIPPCIDNKRLKTRVRSELSYLSRLSRTTSDEAWGNKDDAIYFIIDFTDHKNLIILIIWTRVSTQRDGPQNKFKKSEERDMRHGYARI